MKKIFFFGGTGALPEAGFRVGPPEFLKNFYRAPKKACLKPVRGPRVLIGCIGWQ